MSRRSSRTGDSQGSSPAAGSASAAQRHLLRREVPSLWERMRRCPRGRTGERDNDNQAKILPYIFDGGIIVTVAPKILLPRRLERGSVKAAGNSRCGQVVQMEMRKHSDLVSRRSRPGARLNAARDSEKRSWRCRRSRANPARRSVTINADKGRIPFRLAASTHIHWAEGESSIA